MNRRRFLNRLGLAVLGGYAAVGLPIDWLPKEPRRTWLLSHMTKLYNDHSKGISGRVIGFTLGQKAWNELNSELQPLQRFVSIDVLDGPSGVPTLLFKGARVARDEHISPWSILVKMDS